MDDYINSLHDKTDIYSGNPSYLPEHIGNPYNRYESACEELHAAQRGGLVCKEDLEELRKTAKEAKLQYESAIRKEYPEYFLKKDNDIMASSKTEKSVKQPNASETVAKARKTSRKSSSKTTEKKSETNENTVAKPTVNTDKIEKSEQAGRKAREPQMVTINGDKVSHGHIFESSQTPGSWFFSARLNGEQMKIRRISPEEAEAFRNKEIGVPELMERYHPTKLMKRLSQEELAAGRTLSDGRVVEKFNFYKEANPGSPDVGKYKMYAQVDGAKMSVLAPKAAINEYFDKVATPARLVETHMGEKLHLASAYDKFVIPDGVEVDKIRLVKNPSGPWEIKARINGKETEAKTLSFDDGYSHFKAKTATESQLAAKYFDVEIKAARLPSLPLKEDNDLGKRQSASMKR